MLIMLTIFILIVIMFILVIYDFYLGFKINRLLKSNFKLMEMSEFMKVRSWLDPEDYYETLEIDRNDPNFIKIDSSLKKLLKKNRMVRVILLINFFIFFIMGVFVSISN